MIKKLGAYILSEKTIMFFESNLEHKDQIVPIASKLSEPKIIGDE